MTPADTQQLHHAIRLTYTVAEAARALGIGRGRAYELVADGTIPHVRFGRLIRIPVADLEAWLREQSRS